jgi:hypothetical protein
VIYTYSVNGQSYRSDEVNAIYAGMCKETDAAARAAMGPYRDGSVVRVYYNPAYPAEALLNRGASVEPLAGLMSLGMIGIGLVFTAFAAKALFWPSPPQSAD